MKGSAVVSAARVDSQACGTSLDALDGGVEDEDAAAEHGILPGLEVACAHPPEGVQVHRELSRPWGGQDDGACPVQQTAGKLEAGVLLADDEEALARIAGRIARVDVVGCELDAWRLGQERLGDTDREDDDAAPVRAGGGVQDVVVAIASGTLPGRLVADAQSGAHGEAGDACLHLRARRELRGAVHERRHDRAMLGFEGHQAVPVIPLVGLRIVAQPDMRLGPRKEALEEGKVPEHAPRPRVRRDDGVVDAEAREVVGGL